MGVLLKGTKKGLSTESGKTRLNTALVLPNQARSERLKLFLSNLIVPQIKIQEYLQENKNN